MKDKLSPDRCFLCNRIGAIKPAEFRHIYPQKGVLPISLDWWECNFCRGWFVYPVPSEGEIRRYWATVTYVDKECENKIFREKEILFQRILSLLSSQGNLGKILDFGSNYGSFLIMAHKQGWECYGFEPFEPAAEELRKKGFDVRGGWSLETAGFSESYFDAITATDVFCYVHEPFTTLAAFYRLLKPAGTLVMRVSNKRVILGLVRAFTLKGPGRDAKLSGMLQEQFHSVSVTELKTILKSIGFDFVKIIPGATTAPWRSLSYKTRAAYLIAALIEFLTFGLIEISPGVVILARKK